MLHITLVRGDLVETDGVLILPAPLLCIMGAMMDASKHLLERDIVFLDTKSKGRPARWIKFTFMRA